MSVRQSANAMLVLEYFAERLRPATPAEIADALGWARSSTFKLVGVLAGMGYLYQPHSRAGYYPTSRWLALAERVAGADPLPEAVRTLVREVRAETGETTAIAAPAGAFAVFVDVDESRQPVRFSTRVGERVPIQASSAGRALLAQMTADERANLYRRIAFDRYSATTPTSPEAVEAELVDAEGRGYQQSEAEFTPDLAGVAMPLPVAGRRLSMVVVGPISRCLARRAELAAILGRRLASLPSAGVC